VIALRGEAAEVRDLAGRAELLVQAAGGYVSPEAEAAFREVLDRDPVNGAARFYLGLLDWQTGRPDRAFSIWRDLLEQSPPDAPWVAPIRAGIGELAQMAGVRYTPPPEGAAPLRGPQAADIDAAGRMSAADRMDMISGMVSGLAQRLADQGGAPDEWAQLIRAYGVLQQTDRADAAWRQAQAAHGRDPGAMDIIRAAAQDAGVAP
jgi:cytochrome c-type biogenesis protein CcmH